MVSNLGAGRQEEPCAIDSGRHEAAGVTSEVNLGPHNPEEMA